MRVYKMAKLLARAFSTDEICVVVKLLELFQAMCGQEEEPPQDFKDDVITCLYKSKGNV